MPADAFMSRGGSPYLLPVAFEDRTGIGVWKLKGGSRVHTREECLAMIPVLFNLPAIVLLLVGGAMVGSLLTQGERKRKWLPWVGVGGGVAGALMVGAWGGWLGATVPLRGYGAMITLGFLMGIWMARRRAPLLGVAPNHCLDVGLWGLVGGLAGARVFHVLQNVSDYSPYGEAGAAALLNVFKVWEGGLVFYGAFVPAICIAALYCKINKIPIVPFLDLAAPSLIMGQAFGRIGCFLFGCCYGKACDHPWGVHFPAPAPGHDFAVVAGGGAGPLGLHPTQLYGSLGAFLVALFLYTFWPRRRFDGQVLGFMIFMAGATRFVEELLRADTGAPAFGILRSWAPSLSVAQWIAIVLMLFATLWLGWFWRKDERYVPM